jgi:hypothetical protein
MLWMARLRPHPINVSAGDAFAVPQGRRGSSRW